MFAEKNGVSNVVVAKVWKKQTRVRRNQNEKIQSDFFHIKFSFS